MNIIWGITMKKTFSAFFLFFLIIHSNFGVELWNGFSSDMSEEIALARASEILSLVGNSKEIPQGTFSLNLPLPLMVRNYSMPGERQFRFIGICSGLDGLSKYKYTNPRNAYYNENTEYGPNIIFCFLNKKLFAIKIIWEATNKDLVNLSRQRFGSPTSIVKYKESSTPFSDPDDEMPMWRLQGRDYFVFDNSMIYIDQQARNNYISEKERLEREKREQEERERKEAASKVQF